MKNVSMVSAIDGLTYAYVRLQFIVSRKRIASMYTYLWIVDRITRSAFSLDYKATEVV